MSIQIIRPGLLTSLQDLGRIGYQKYGVIASGGMDPFALRLANLLVGNEEGEAVLEITLMGPTLLVEQDVLIALTGGDTAARIGDAELPMWRPVFVKKGSVITFGGCRNGCRTYMAVAGGFAVPRVLGSKSTYLRAKIGGYQGRALAVDDVLAIGEPSDVGKLFAKRLKERANDSAHAAPHWGITAELLQFYGERSVRVIQGRHFSLFTEESRRDLFQQSFVITPQSDRMGYRLTGPVLQLAEQEEVLSEAISPGTIQVPSEGNPILLMADRQTTGGYPRIAQVVSVDIPVVAQCKPGDRIRFREISLAEAEELYLAREQEIKDLKAGIELKMRSSL
ncbi:5-oxoprolinase subunit C family protein [Brevibacillus migulae]|uniref:5-oxoprolinase subunit C family protein n=1 Tax=Brevibacillus migulae TaxID=1644114 RepID=UPI00106DE6DE|nr:biotin-dependent carboxyltransferase family protein [Brevibacillus migulae]